VAAQVRATDRRLACRLDRVPGADPAPAPPRWNTSNILVLDLETKEGLVLPSNTYNPLGLLDDKHDIWVCPMFRPFLVWLCLQEYTSVTELPDFVALPTDESEMFGHRANGRDRRNEEMWEAFDEIVAAVIEHGAPDAVTEKIAHVDRVLRRTHAPHTVR
jgi:hypothetical protein